MDYLIASSTPPRSLRHSEVIRWQRQHGASGAGGCLAGAWPVNDQVGAFRRDYFRYLTKNFVTATVDVIRFAVLRQP